MSTLPSPGPSSGPSSGRLAYDDAATPDQMSLDARAARAALGVAPATEPGPFPLGELTPGVPKRGEIEIPAAAARLAAALHLQLDGD
jgi:hypothetical protein